MLEAYRQHVAERAALGIPPLPLTAQQTADVIELLKAPPAKIDTAILDATLTRSRAHIARMARLVDERNSPGFRRELDSLRIQQKVVRQIADGLESAK